MNEWEFTAAVAGWINELIGKYPQLPFSAARCEQRSKDSLKRRDLTLLDRNRSIVLTGEVKLPYNKDGGSPHNAAVVRDARAKARRAGTRFFFTWNVNEFVLWETEPADASWQGQKYRSWEVTQVHREGHLDLPMTIHAVRTWLDDFLHEFARIVHGEAAIGHKSPDEKFIEALESSLRLPIQLTLEAITERYQKPRSRSEIDRWMREEQGWVIYDDPEGVRDNLERAAKFACYNLVNKLVFHEALLKRYGDRMEKLSVPEHIDAGEPLRLHMEKYFAEAKTVTQDYETVFGEDHAALGNRIPFYSAAAVVHSQTSKAGDGEGPWENPAPQRGDPAPQRRSRQSPLHPPGGDPRSLQESGRCGGCGAPGGHLKKSRQAALARMHQGIEITDIFT